MFFVFGSPRSGTTLLKEVLNLNTKIYILNETDFVDLTAQVIHIIDDPVQGKEIIYKIIINSNLRSSLTKFLTNEKIYGLVHESEYNFFDIIDSLYQEVLKCTGAEVVGDRSPNYLSGVNFFEHIGLFDKDIKFIHIVRDLRDVLLSLKRMSWCPKDLSLFSETWARTNLKLSKLGLSHPEKYFFMKYEDFILDPEPILYKSCDFLGVKYDASMMNWGSCKKEIHDLNSHKNIGLPPLVHKVGNWRYELVNEPKLLDDASPANNALKFYDYGD